MTTISRPEKMTIIPGKFSFNAAQAIRSLLQQQELSEHDDDLFVTPQDNSVPHTNTTASNSCDMSSPLTSPESSETVSPPKMITQLLFPMQPNEDMSELSTGNTALRKRNTSLSSQTPPDPISQSNPASGTHSPSKTQLPDRLQAPEKNQICSGLKRNENIPTLPGPSNRKKRRNEFANESRNKRRDAKRMDPDYQHIARDKARIKHMQGAPIIQSTFDITTARVASTGYIARPSQKEYLSEGYTLDDLVGERSQFNFRLQRWDGNESMGIVDSENRIIVVLAGHPGDAEEWSSLQAKTAEVLEAQRQKCNIPQHEHTQRRGSFVTLDCGISYGGGQKAPQYLANNPTNRRILEELNSMAFFNRVSGFASSVMATWAPKLHAHYTQLINKLKTCNPPLYPPFPTVFASTSQNLGPKTVSTEHIDNTNAAYGMCGVTPLGDFDYTKGGHLVLWELGLVIEFPPGCTILLPSAIITHSNVKIGTNEKRYSFVQYTAGALFRWVDQGCQSKREYLESLTSSQLLEENQRNAERLEHGLSLFTVVDVAQ